MFISLAKISHVNTTNYKNKTNLQNKAVCQCMLTFVFWTVDTSFGSQGLNGSRSCTTIIARKHITWMMNGQIPIQDHRELVNGQLKFKCQVSVARFDRCCCFSTWPLAARSAPVARRVTAPQRKLNQNHFVAGLEDLRVGSFINWNIRQSSTKYCRPQLETFESTYKPTG